MARRHLLYRTFYALGMTPWDGHPLSPALRDLIEGGSGDGSALPPGSALDVGCGTGDTSIYLARHGWRVTGVDFVTKALEKARGKAHTAGVAADFLAADVTRLRDAGVGSDSSFALIVDNGCLHGMSDEDRDAYVREVNAVAGADARLFIVAFPPGGSTGVRGIGPAEIERRFAGGWRLVAEADEPGREGRTARHYLLNRV